MEGNKGKLIRLKDDDRHQEWDARILDALITERIKPKIDSKK